MKSEIRSQRIAELLSIVLEKMTPKDVAHLEAVVDRIDDSLSDDLGLTEETNDGTGFHIMLNGTSLPEMDEAPACGVIAHELAHAFLGHKDEWYTAGDALAPAELAELEADEQALKWGFCLPRPYDDQSFSTASAEQMAHRLQCEYPDLTR